MLVLMPSISAYAVIATNINYSFGGEMGNYDYYLQTGMVFSNKNAVIKVSLDTSINNLDRYDNLFKSFDFLANKSGYSKYKITIVTNEVVYLRQNDDVYLLYIFEENDDGVLSGILIDVNFNFISNSDNSGKEKIISQFLKEFIENLKIKEISALLK